MANQCEIRLSGSGGQGLILAGIILAEAALDDGKNAVQSQSYGPEARGGASKAEVIISNEEINYPKVINCDILLALTQVALDKYVNTLKKGGTLIIDSRLQYDHRDDVRIISLPIIDVAKEELKKPMVANIVALGIINKFAKLVSEKALKEAVLNRVPRGTEELNERALKVGYELMEKIKE